MRYIAKNRPEHLDERTIYRKFLWFPMVLHGETRWLERASWLEKYFYYGFPSEAKGWVPVEWVTERVPHVS